MFRPGAYESKPDASRDAAIMMREKIAGFLEGLAKDNAAEHQANQRYWLYGCELSDAFILLAANIRKINL